MHESKSIWLRFAVSVAVAVCTLSACTKGPPEREVIAPMKAYRSGPAAVTLTDGRVLVTGGIDVGSKFKKLSERDTGLSHNIQVKSEIWDPVTQTFTMSGQVGYPRYDDGAVAAMPGGGALSTAGHHEHSERYNPATGLWSRAAPRKRGLNVSMGQLYLGGQTPDILLGLASGDALHVDLDGQFHLYDAGHSAWGAKLSSPPLRQRKPCAVALADATAMFIGGLNAPAPGARAVLTLDPGADAWTRRTDLPDDRVEHGCVQLSDRRVWVYGGRRGISPDKRHTGTWLWDPDTDVWSAGPALPATSLDSKAAMLPDGRVVVFRGRDVWLVDATASKVRVVGTLSKAVAGYDVVTVEVESEPAVLVVGGRTKNGKSVNTAELWRFNQKAGPHADTP